MVVNNARADIAILFGILRTIRREILLSAGSGGKFRY